MQKIKLSSVQLSLVGAGVVILAAAILMRNISLSAKFSKSDLGLSDAGIEAVSSTDDATGTVPEGLPAPTSAHFQDGQPLQSLGPNWSFLRQQDQRMLSMSYFPGTAPMQESVVQLIENQDISLLIEESSIVDKGMLQKALDDTATKKVKVGDRGAYLIPMGGLDGGNALLLTGSSTVLILQDANAANWPDELHPEVKIYISSVNVP